MKRFLSLILLLSLSSSAFAQQGEMVEIRRDNAEETANEAAESGEELVEAVQEDGAGAVETAESTVENVADSTAQQAASAPAGPPQAVYVVATTSDDSLQAVTARVGAAARAGLRPIESARWAEADRVFLGYDAATLQRVQEARRELEEGRSAYVDLRLDEATQHLAAAVESFDGAVAALEDPADLGTALLYLGASQAFNGDERGARQTFRRMHVQMPHIVPDEGEFPPEVIQFYEQAAPRGRAGALEITSDPEGAIAYVDFVPRGTTPVVVEDLPPGDHIVRIVRPGATPYIENVTLRRRGASVSAFLLPNEGHESLAETADSLASHELEVGDGAVSELAAGLELDKIAVIRVSPGASEDTVALDLFMFNANDGEQVLRGHVDSPRALGELEPVVQRSVQAAIENALRPRVNTVVEQVEADEPPPWMQNNEPEEEGGGGKAWLWIVGGVVVAGAVATVLYFTLRDDTSPGQNSGGQVVFEF